MFSFIKMIRAARDGDKMIELYERALNAANRYLPIKMGPGNAKLASLMLNEILCEDLFEFKSDALSNLPAQDRPVVEKKAKAALKDDPLLRELMIHTLWIKWLADKSHNREAAVRALEEGWAFKTYSSQYPPMTLREYQALVNKFENQAVLELGKYLEAHSKGAR